MLEEKIVQEPFQFYTRLHLSELTGLKASNLGQLLEILRAVPGACVYHHTHRFLQQHQYLSPEPPNDFAYWVTQILGERVLGEELASIDTVQFSTIRALREKILSVIEEYIRDNTGVKDKRVHPGEEFHFIKSVSFILPTHYAVKSLDEFIDALSKVTIDSIYFHIFEARLRLEKKTNDFSNWLETSLNEPELAAGIAQLDPYTHTMEDLRKVMIRMIEKKMKG